MRAFYVVVGILWFEGMALYVGATERPQEFAAAVGMVNEQLEPRTGFAIPDTAEFHKRNAGVIVVVTSVFLFFSLLHFVRKARTLQARFNTSQTASSKIREVLEELEENTNTRGNTLDELEKKLPDFEERVTDLEGISSRAQKLQASWASLKDRLEKADGTQDEDLNSILNDCADTHEKLENALDEIEGDENIDDLEAAIPGLEQRIAALEKVNQRALALTEQLDGLEERLDEADGDDESHLSLFGILLQSNEKVEEIEKTLDEIEENDPENQIAGLEVKAVKLRRKIERVKQSNQQASTLRGELEALEQKLEQRTDNPQS